MAVGLLFLAGPARSWDQDFAIPSFLQADKIKLLGKQAEPLAGAFCEETLQLATRGLRFDQEWQPPGEMQPLKMDCSGTICYLFRKVAGLVLPRMACDQYRCLREQGVAWDLPDSVANVRLQRAYLKAHLRPGDLIFWRDTCRPVHDLPITHVMLYLGRNEMGASILAGSQTAQRIPGYITKWRGGVDIYIYDPTDDIGGYVNREKVYHEGRVQAIGRPLEADRARLADQISKLP